MAGTAEWQLGEQFELRAVEEDGVVSDEVKLQWDHGSGDPQVADMLRLVQRVTHRAALVARPGVRPGGLVVDGQHPAAVWQSLHGLQPPLAPAGRNRAVANLGDASLGDRAATAACRAGGGGSSGA